MQAVISVIMPVYNCEKYIERAVMSVLQQPCAEYAELLIVDDGSKDNSSEIIDKIAAAHENVRAFHKENGGVSSARNLGIDNANGKYLAFLDADDWWEPGFFDEELLKELQRPEKIDIFGFGYRQINYDHTLCKDHPRENAEYFFDEYSGKHSWDAFVSLFYRTEYIEKNSFRFPAAKVREDIAFSGMSLYFASSIKYIDKIIYNYYENLGSVMHKSNTFDRFVESVKTYKYEKEAFEERGINYEIDRQIVSMIIDLLPDWCANNRYRFVREFTQSDACALLQDDSIKPWSYLQKAYDRWKKHPKMFWLKSRIWPGTGYAVKGFCYRIPCLRKLANYVQHRFIQKWERIKN